ncbi:hypothetical protein HOB10_04680 [Candidatus Parcubacteria bacterium]|jgi:hypothetical protein|nr:hypothetical protein [Candidatus Parcubacteria bacterium]
MSKNNAPKFAFFYLLSLVALVFTSVSVGIIIFQIINKEIVDIIDQFQGSYSDGAMKFAISTIIISTPIYYLTSRQIYKNLFKGNLDEESGVRKWLTYLILLVSIIVMIGWLIGIINGFLDGELTTKFMLKGLTALVISGSIFSFYLYDIRRENIKGKKDKVIKVYFYASLLVILVAFVSSWFIVESPAETRKRKSDQNIISDFYTIDSSLSNYYQKNDVLPQSLDDLDMDKYSRLDLDDLTNPFTDKKYEYKVISEDEYEVCTDFQTSNKEEEYDRYKDDQWQHEVGYQCIGQRVMDRKLNDVEVIR